VIWKECCPLLLLLLLLLGMGGAIPLLPLYDFMARTGKTLLLLLLLLLLLY
jgi:hypothetical protein